MVTLHNWNPVLVQGHAGAGVSLLGAFQVKDDQAPIDLPRGCQRLLAFLALHGKLFRRDTVAGSLWPESSEVRAHASLRSALARLHRATSGVVHSSPTEVGIAEGVAIDLFDAREQAHALLGAPAQVIEPAAARSTVAMLSTELLPGWYDDWVLIESENWRQLRLHALEALARSLAASGQFGEATGAALAAVAADPLRESAHAVLIRVHLAEGNRSEALRAIASYRRLLNRELGLEPSPQLEGLVAAPHR